jgi:hypothetical protein
MSAYDDNQHRPMSLDPEGVRLARAVNARMESGKFDDKALAAAVREASASPDPHREPSADARTAARACRDVYLALRAEGFTGPEALRIVGQIIQSTMPTGGAA